MGGGQIRVFVVLKTMTISDVNAMGKDEFLKKFGGVYEHSRWAAEGVESLRPFGSFEQLASQMRGVVDVAGDGRKLELIMAHPDLAGKLAMEELTEESRKEQAGVGLDRLDKEEFELFTGLNEAYRELFGFPFIICVGKTDKPGILRSFNKRLLNGREEELRTALEEVHGIAGLRIAAVASQP